MNDGFYTSDSGNYWSSSLNTDNSWNAWSLYFNSDKVRRGDTYITYRYYGYSVRPVYGEYIAEAMMPTVTTYAITQITETTAVAGGNVTSDGGATVTERGVVYSTSSNPTTSSSKVNTGSGTGAFSCNLSNLQENTTYYVRAYAINKNGTSYGEQNSFTTNKSTSSNTDYQYVDLGLSVKWATCNVGASKPEESGDYFAWGETTTKSTYSWGTYTYCKGSSTTLTKYNCSSGYGTLDNKTTLELSDDVAAINWGGAWRMPTHEELEELLYKCTWTWCWDYAGKEGLFGYLVTSKVNGNAIFLPSTGSYGQEWYGSDMTEGYAEYMTSTLLPGVTSNYCTCMYFYYQDYDFNTTYDWYPGDVHRGRTIRPVISK